MSSPSRLLFSPLRVGNITVQNRIVFSAHLTNFAEDFMPTDRHACVQAPGADFFRRNRGLPGSGAPR